VVYRFQFAYLFMTPEQEPKRDFKKLAAEAFSFKNIEFKDTPKVRAILYQGDREIAKGSAEVGDGRVLFHPDVAHVLENLMPTPAHLTLSESGHEVRLSQSQVDFELSSRLIWFFDYVA
jgi:hypothetical protein